MKSIVLHAVCKVAATQTFFLSRLDHQGLRGNRRFRFILALLVLWTLPAALPAQAQFLYTTNNGTITITGYAGFGGAATIPSTLNGLPVTSIGANAFCSEGRLTKVTIPNSVTTIGNSAFGDCIRLTSVTIGNNVTNIGCGAFYSCSRLTSVTIPDSVTSIGNVAFISCTSLTNVTMGKGVSTIGFWAFSGCRALTDLTIGESVTRIGKGAFSGCSALTSITIPNCVTSIGGEAFSDCASLSKVFFRGNVPPCDLGIFNRGNSATFYYLPGTTGWEYLFGEFPTAWWHLPYPVILGFGPGFGVRTNRFGFIISWAANAPVLVEACTNLGSPVWFPVSTNFLTDGWSYFSDCDWTNHPVRFYRLRPAILPPPQGFQESERQGD